MSQNIGELVAITAANFIQIQRPQSDMDAPRHTFVCIEVRGEDGKLIAKQSTIFRDSKEHIEVKENA